MRKKQLTLPTQEERIQRKENNQVTKLVVIVTVTFAVCVLPYHVVGLLFEFTDDDVNQLPYIHDIFDVSYYVLFLNSAMNPIIYNVFSSNFRKAVFRLRKNVCCVCVLRSTVEVPSGKRARKVGLGVNQEMQRAILTQTVNL